MPELEDRVGLLEKRVDHLVAWAGPGQAQALSLSLQQTRAELAKIQRTQEKHSRQLAQLGADVAALKTDVAALKTDMVEVKAAVREILRRLPPVA